MSKIYCLKSTIFTCFDFILKCKSLFDYISLLSSNKYKNQKNNVSVL